MKSNLEEEAKTNCEKRTNSVKGQTITSAHKRVLAKKAKPKGALAKRVAPIVGQ
ncbi:hypothetical protein L0244_40445 [bacterium]|nr:hypothetical protein [bacterium]